MEESKVLIKEVPYPFDKNENRLLESDGAKCIIDYRGDGKLVMGDGQLALSYDEHWWKK